MPENEWEKEFNLLREDCWKLIWPTHDFMHNIVSPSSPQIVQKVSGLDVVVEKNIEKDKLLDHDGNSILFDRRNFDCNGVLFFQPKDFALMELDIHQRMHVFKVNSAIFSGFKSSTVSNRIKNSKSVKNLNDVSNVSDDNSNFAIHGKTINHFEKNFFPHIKSYLRLMKNVNNYCNESSNEVIIDNQKCICHELAWCLITSACLTRGMS
jgi:hypothetical protein